VEQCTNKELSIKAQRVAVVIEKAIAELEVVDAAWKEFQRRTRGLAVMQPELLGQPVNVLTNTMDRFYSLISGQSTHPEVKVLNVTGESSPQSAAQIVVAQKRRGEIISTLMDTYIDSMI